MRYPFNARIATKHNLSVLKVILDPETELFLCASCAVNLGNGEPPMLKLDDSLEKVAIFACDIAGMATKYEMTVVRWGFESTFGCVVSKDDSELHEKWLAVDVFLSDETLQDQFITDCAIAGLYCKVGGECIHIQNVPFTEVG